MNTSQSRSGIAFWDEKDGDDRAAAVNSLANRLWANQDYRRRMNEHAARLYGDMPLLGLTPWAYQSIGVLNDGPTVAVNIVRSQTDTILNNLVQVKIRPMVLTTGGSWPMRQKAKSLQKAIDGTFNLTDWHNTEARLVKDAIVFGTAAVKFGAARKGKKFVPFAERVLLNELLIDEADAFDGRPTFIIHRKPVHRLRLAARYPKLREQILALPKPTDPDMVPTSADTLGDLVIVDEAWHLPSADGAGDGIHTICASGVELESEPWEHDRFPFEFLHFDTAFAGFWGNGLPFFLTGTQLFINRFLLNFQEAAETVATPRIVVPNGSRIIDTEINDEIGAIIHTSGEAPVAMTAPAYSQDVYQLFWAVVEKSYFLQGVSQLDAGGVKPAGVNSGIAQRTYADIVAKRITDLQHRREDFNVRAAKQFIRIAREMVAAGEEHAVLFRDKKGIERLDWKDVDMDDDAFDIQFFPASAMPQEPSARFQFAQELFNAGLIGRAAERRLLSFPDPEFELELSDSPYDLVLMRLTEIADTGEYLAPEEFMDLDLCVKLGNQFYSRCSIDRLDEDRLALIRQFITDALALQHKTVEDMAMAKAPGPSAGAPEMQSPTAAPMPPGMMPPPGAPGAPPVPGGPMPMPAPPPPPGAGMPS